MDTEQIAPYTLAISDDAISDLHRRLDAARWPDENPDAGWSDGLPLDYARELADHWRTRFDWRAQEARLNAVPQFTAPIDGHDVHFFHVRSPRSGAVPLVLVHGWPSAPTDFFGMIPALTEPQEGEQAFDLVIPTVPGFGISGPVSGWTVARVADAVAVLMQRLGYDRFLAHGYDIGAGVVREIGIRHPEAVAGIHTTGMIGGEELTAETAGMSVPEEARAVEIGRRYAYDLGAYAMLQGTRPQSLAYGLTDSPIGLMSWLVERFRDWSGVEGGPEEVLDRDEMLTVVGIYWFFGTLGSSARYYKYGLPDWGEPLPASSVPTAILVMPQDIMRPVRRLAEKTDRIVQWTEAERGGHFAAWERPSMVADDIRAGIGHLR